MTARGIRVAQGLVVPALLLVLWWVVSAHSTSPYFPPLSRIVNTFGDIWLFERVDDDLVPSVTRLVIGFLIAAGVGISSGILFGLSPRARRDAAPITEFCRAMPIAALVPLALILFGAGPQMEVALIAFGCCWPILVSTTDGVRGTDPMMVDVARIYGLSQRQRIWRVAVPAAMPQIFAGLRIALAIGIATMIISNMFGSANGLGYFIIDAQQSFNVARMWAGILMIGLVGALASTSLVAIEYRVLAWHRGWRASATEAT